MWALKDQAFCDFCHCEVGWTSLIIRPFSINLVCTGDVFSQSSVQQGRKCGVQGAEAVDITIGDHFVHFSKRLGALPQYGLLWFFEKLRGDQQKTDKFSSGFPFWRRPNRFGNSSVLRQPCSHRCCTQSSTLVKMS